MRNICILLFFSSFGQLAAQTFEKIIPINNQNNGLFNFTLDDNLNTYFIPVYSEQRRDSLLQNNFSTLIKIDSKGDLIKRKTLRPSDLDDNWNDSINHVMATTVEVIGDSLQFTGNIRSGTPTTYSVLRFKSDLNFNFGAPETYRPLADSIPILLSSITKKEKSIYFGERYNVNNGVSFARLSIFEGTSYKEVSLFDDNKQVWGGLINKLLQDKKGNIYQVGIEYNGPPFYFLEGPTILKYDSNYNFISRERLTVPTRHQQERNNFTFSGTDAMWITDSTFLISTAASNNIDTTKGDIHFFEYNTDLNRISHHRLISTDTNIQTRINCLAYDSITESFYFGATQIIEEFWSLFFYGRKTAFRLLKMDKNLNIVWDKYYYHNATIQMDELEVDRNGNITMAGGYEDSTTRADGSERSLYILRVDSLGNYLNTTIYDEHTLKKNNVLIYPIPFSEKLTISKLNLPRNCNVRFFNLLGKEILNLNLNSNIQEINTQSWNSGIYIYSITNQNGYQTSGRIVKK